MIRLASTGDAAAVLPMMSAFYAEEELTMHRATYAALNELLADPHLGAVLIDDAGDALAGYVAITLGFSLELGGRDAFVDELFVTPPYRRQGRGGALLEAAKGWARGAGARVLLLEVALPSESKLRLYRGAGFGGRPHPLMACPLA